MKTAFITGANRGIGLCFTEQLIAAGYHVIATCRDPKHADDLQALTEQTEHLQILQLDVNSQQQIDELAERLANQPIDLLINNAGISGERGVTVGNIDRNNFMQVMETNCLSVVKVCEAFLPHVKQSQDKLIITISSRMGSISDNERGQSYAYRASKAALNCVMRSFAIDIAEQGVNVLLFHPGWVQTRMGGVNDAPVTPLESVTGMLEQIKQHGANAHAETLHRFDGGEIAW